MAKNATMGLASEEMDVFSSHIKAVTMQMEKMTKPTE
jgi:hypothetical protein